MATIERQFAEQFAQDWIDAWNCHDLDRILAHYADDFEFSSPKIVELMGERTGTIKGPDGHPNSPTCGHFKIPHPRPVDVAA